LDIEAIPIDDPKTYQLYCEGRTTGTFQFESAGMQKYLIELQPSTFEDLIAMNALYRPGPMDYIPDFIARKKGEKPITYDFPCMEKYLKDTYGITVYQEQVMLLSRQLAGFTRGQSDTLRKAMGKKQIEKMNHLEGLFYEGGEKNGFDHDTLNKIWEDWKKFASYAFNKSHATCYSWVAYQTAYLKANYPSEYMAAVLSRNLNDVDKLSKFMDECKSMGIRVLGPDINESFKLFSANKQGDIRFGLGGIKGVGSNAVDAVVEERNSNGPFKDIYDLVERVNLGSCNRKAIESFALAGAFDSFGEVTREAFFEKNPRDGMTFSETITKFGQRFQAGQSSMQNSLFGDLEPLEVAKPEIPKAEPWNIMERLSREKELVGMYLSAHPLDPYYLEVNFGCNTTLADLPGKNELIDQELTVAGLVVDYTVRMGKRGQFGILKVEDYTGTYEFMLFGQQFIDYNKYGIIGTPIMIHGAYQTRYGGEKKNARFNIQSISLLEDMKGKTVRNIRVTINDDEFELAKELKRFMTDKEGAPCDLYFRVQDVSHRRYVDLRAKQPIMLSKHLIDTLHELNLDFRVNAVLNS
jgi:DNA polymerase-3 subunit alpha